MSASPASHSAGLSVFFPAYNDSGTIASMVIRAVQAASKLTEDYEVIVVNDGSADATAQIADELAEKYPHVRVVHHPVNRGYGGALQTGFRSATKESDLLHGRRRAVRSGGARRFVEQPDARGGPRERLQDQPLRSAAPDHHRTALSPHRLDAVRPVGARRRLRFPADAPDDLRSHRAPQDERRHLPRDDEEDRGRRVSASSKCRCTTTTARSENRSSSIFGESRRPASTSCGCGSRWS